MLVRVADRHCSPTSAITSIVASRKKTCFIRAFNTADLKCNLSTYEPTPEDVQHYPNRQDDKIYQLIRGTLAITKHQRTHHLEYGTDRAYEIAPIPGARQMRHTENQTPIMRKNPKKHSDFGGKRTPLSRSISLEIVSKKEHRARVYL